MPGTVLSMHLGVMPYLLPHPPVLYVFHNYCLCAVDKCNPCSVFALCSTGDCAGAVLWHRVCGPAVVGRLSQQICGHQRTPPLYQEAHINHRCTWHFPLLPFNTTDVMNCSCISTTWIIHSMLGFIDTEVIATLFFFFVSLCLSHRFDCGHCLHHCARCRLQWPSVCHICHQVE